MKPGTVEATVEAKDRQFQPQGQSAADVADWVRRNKQSDIVLNRQRLSSAMGRKPAWDGCFGVSSQEYQSVACGEAAPRKTTGGVLAWRVGCCVHHIHLGIRGL